MDPLTTDPGLYFRRVGERLIGMFGCYLDFPFAMRDAGIFHFTSTLL
jgi:hypothetical protein